MLNYSKKILIDQINSTDLKKKKTFCIYDLLYILNKFFKFLTSKLKIIICYLFANVWKQER